jgi:YihY family inner membrane protein
LETSAKEHGVTQVANPDAGTETAVQAVGVIDAVEPATRSKWYQWRKDGTALVKYLLDCEVHTYAFSVAANAILSFIPVIVLLYTLSRGVFHSQAMVSVVNDMVHYFLPNSHYSFLPDPSKPDWAASHLVLVAPRHGVQLFSLLMILVSCTGIFLPLEVALNQAWGVTKSRSLLMNQVVAFGLAFLMVLLGLGSMLLNTGAREVLALVFFHHTDTGFLGSTYQLICYVLLAATTGVASILFFFSIYWLLPNRKVPWRPVFRVAMVTGTIWLASKYIFVALLPRMDLDSLYGPFSLSVGLLFWAYTSGLILFAGAQFSVSRLGAGKDR